MRASSIVISFSETLQFKFKLLLQNHFVKWDIVRKVRVNLSSRLFSVIADGVIGSHSCPIFYFVSSWFFRWRLFWALDMRSCFHLSLGFLRINLVLLLTGLHFPTSHLMLRRWKSITRCSSDFTSWTNQNCQAKNLVRYRREQV